MAEVAAELVRRYGEVTGHAYQRRTPAAAELRADELNNRALSLMDLGRTGDANEAFAAALAVDPRHLAATYNWGLVRWRNGTMTDEALIADLEAVRADTGDSPQARNLLAMVNAERGDVPAVRALLANANGDSEGEALLADLQSGIVTDARGDDERDLPWYPRPGKKGFPRLNINMTPDGRRALTGTFEGLVQVWDVPASRCLRELERCGLGGVGVGISPDGRFGVSAHRAGASDQEGSVRFWDLDTGRCLRTFSRSDIGRLVYSVHLIDQDRLVMDVAGAVQVWNPRSGQRVFTIDGHRTDVSSDGRWVLERTDEGGPARCLWDLATGRTQSVRPGLEGRLVAGAAQIIATASHFGDGIVCIEDLVEGRPRCILQGHDREFSTLALSSDGRVAVSGHLDGAVRLWDLVSGSCIRTFRDHRGAVGAVLLSAAGRRALSASEDNTVRTWRLPGGYSAPFQLSRPCRDDVLIGLAERVSDLIRRAGQATAVGRRTVALRLLTEARETPGHERAPRVLTGWRELSRELPHVGLRTGWPTAVLSELTHVFSVDLSADGRTAVASTASSQIHLWNPDSGDPARVLESRHVYTVRLSGDKQRIAGIGGSGCIEVLSAETGERLSYLQGFKWNGAGHHDRTEVHFSTDLRLALIGSKDGPVRLVDLTSSSCVLTLPGHEGEVTSVWLSPDGRLAASGGADHRVRIWNLASRRCLHVLEGHTDVVSSVCLSPTGRHLLSTGGHTNYTVRRDTSVRLWDVATGACVRVFDDQPDNANAVRFSGDGRYALSGGSDHTVRVWDVRSGHCMRALEGHRNAVNDVAWAPDGLRALSAGRDGTARIWELDWDLAATTPIPDDSR